MAPPFMKWNTGRPCRSKPLRKASLSEHLPQPALRLLGHARLIQSISVDEVFPARFALVQAMDESIPAIDEVVEVVEIFHFQDREAKVVGGHLFPVALDLVGLFLPFRWVEGDGQFFPLPWMTEATKEP